MIVRLRAFVEWSAFYTVLYALQEKYIGTGSSSYSSH
jgi:hypothetical protein